MKKPFLLMSTVALVSFNAQAAEETYQASVQVLTPITITQVIAMSFGKILASTNGSPNSFVSFGGPAADSGDGFYISGAQSGVVAVNADGGGYLYDISVAPVANGCTSTDLTLSILTVPSTSSAQSTSISVDGVLNVPSGTAAGSYTCDYTVTANYQ